MLRRYHMKGLKWGSAQCWLSEICGFLRWQQLWGRNTKPPPHAPSPEELRLQLGMELDFEPGELAEWARDLEKRVTDKERRSSEDAERKRDAARAHR